MKKNLTVLLHLCFLLLIMAGLCFININDNRGRGISWLGSETYEDTKEFSDQLRSDITGIFNYVNYKDLFETDGEIDYSKDILSVRYDNKRDVTYTLDEMVRYAKTRGFYLDDNFQVVKNQSGVIVPDRENLLINWKAYMPNEVLLEPGDAFATLEQLSREVLEKLGEYYTIRYHFVDRPTNLYFRVAYSDSAGNVSLYTNAKDKTFEELTKYGRFLSLTGDSLSPVTNLSSPPNDVATLLEKNNPYDNYNSSVVIAVDTAYSNPDSYAAGAYRYHRMYLRYLYGLIMLGCGLAGCLCTFLYLLPLSGHRSKGSPEITLQYFDRIPTDAGILVYAAAIWAGLYLGRLIGFRLIHLVFEADHWGYLERLLSQAIVYLISLTAVFSIVRRYKANTLWSNSILCRFSNGFSTYLVQHNFRFQITLAYIAFLGFNLFGIIWLCRLYFLEKNALDSLEFWGVSAALVLADLTFFLKLLRTSLEKDKIDEALYNISTGDTGYKVDLKYFTGRDRIVAENINNISAGLENALQEKVKSERLKADLITNVSHDIKTPLTSIINYVALIKREKIQDPKILQYLEVLDQKSQRLKTLTEDLVEASKASSGNLKLDMAKIGIVALVQQTNGEFEEKLALRHLELVTNVPDHELFIEADGRRLWRVLENLYNNTCKYAMEHTRVYVDIYEEDGIAVFTIKNVSENPLNINAEELTERFVRGDVARTTEGSGLGLSIAKDLTALQKGDFQIIIDGDLFKVKISFPLFQEKEEAVQDPEDS